MKWFSDRQKDDIDKKLKDIINQHKEELEQADGVKKPPKGRLAKINHRINDRVNRVISKNQISPVWNLREIREMHETDSLFRRAVEKYVELIFRQGYELVGEDKENIEYIRIRLAQMEEVTRKPTQELLDEVAFNLVTYNNGIIIKRRSNTASGGHMRTTFYGKELVPVAGYFVADPTFITIQMDQYGNPQKYKQMKDFYYNAPRTYTELWRNFWNQMQSSTHEQSWPMENVIHMRDRTSTPSDVYFSMPMAYPVLPDIRALRELEELLLLQSNKLAAMRSHAKIGSEDKYATDPLIRYYESYLSGEDWDGILVTPHDVDISNINKDDPAMSLVQYTAHFKWRVQAGLGMSDISFGAGGTSNRNTASEMTDETQNTAAKFARIIQDFFNKYVIKELLMESGKYNEFNITPKDMVYLRINEIDLERKIKRESHAVDKWTKNIITQDECRREIGYDPLSDEERQLTHGILYAKETEVDKETDNKNNPTNQHGRQNGRPSKQKRKD